MLPEIFPWHDLRTLLWLRWRQFQDDAVYWLRLLGYDSTATGLTARLYVVYLVGIAAIWALSMWAWGFDMAARIGPELPNDTLAQILNLIPLIIVVIQGWAIFTALRSTPLKLTFSDMAYVAGSPMARSVPVLLGFVRQVITRILLFGGGWTLLTVLLLGPTGQPVTFGDVLRVVVTVGLLVVLTWAIAWVLGILRLVYPTVSRWPLALIVPVLLGLTAWLLPDAVLWPGRALVLAVYGLLPGWLLAALIVMAAGLTVSFVWLGNRINMIQAVDESRVYARLAALGLMAWRMPDLQLRIRRQQSQAGRKPWLSLPRATGQRALFMRSLVSYARHPLLLAINALWGALMAYIVGLILAHDLPVPIWIGWLLIAGIMPPLGLLHTFRMDMQEPFLRQFLPLNGLQILVADIALPWLMLALGALGAWLIQPLPVDVSGMGVIAIPLLSFLLALCGAYAMTTERELQARLLATAASFGLAISATVALGTAYAGLGIIMAALLVLMGLLTQEA